MPYPVDVTGIPLSAGPAARQRWQDYNVFLQSLCRDLSGLGTEHRGDRGRRRGNHRSRGLPVKFYARVRRAVILNKMSERKVSRQFGLARETVRKMLRSSIPPSYRQRHPPRLQ